MPDPRVNPQRPRKPTESDASTSLLRSHSAAARTTNIELFFDLAFAFAVTQLSHHLLTHPSVKGGLQTLLLFAMVWLVWVYTTWFTNFLDPQRLPIRVALLALMAGGLVLSAAIPNAFAGGGPAIGIAYAAMQIGRSLFGVSVMGDDRRLQLNFERVTIWCAVSGALAVVGGFEAHDTRGLLWFLAVTCDVVGGMVGFYVPRMGRAHTHEWQIEGNHFAERCQAFLLIALGESVVAIGATLSGLRSVSVTEGAGFLAAFTGAAALWWIYFDRAAEAAAETIAGSDDPGRLGHRAYHLLHPVMIAGIITIAAADDRVLGHPSARPSVDTTLLILGGTALFLAGDAAFVAAVWRKRSPTRVIAIVVLGLLGFLAPHVANLALGCCAGAVLVAVAVADRLTAPALSPAPEAGPDAQPLEAVSET
jgi:low temperature requirement protein LtrA